MRVPVLVWCLKIVSLSVVCGCATYTSPFVHKSEDELEAMERLDMDVAADFSAGRYTEAGQKLDQLTAEPTVSRTLYELERVSVLLQQGRRVEAHALMSKVRADIELLYDPASEEKAVSLWHGENNKVFKGDAHERAVLYVFLAMSYMDLGEWDDAERCVKNGLLADSANTEEARYNSDFALLQYLGYVICKKAGRDADAQEYAREMRSSLGARGVATDGKTAAGALVDEAAPLPNAFLVIWSGTPPSYVRGGEYEEIRHVIAGGNPYSLVTVDAGDGVEIGVSTGLGDVNFQALTRGGREMDTVLKDKAAAKTGMEVSGNILLVAGFGCLACMGNNSMADLVLLSTGCSCLVLGCTFHIVGACINSKADIRSWKNLPGELLIVPLVLPESRKDVVVRAYKAWDNVLCESVGMTLSQKGISVTHMSLSPFAGRENPKDEAVRRALEAVNAATKDNRITMCPEIAMDDKAEGGGK